MVGQRGEDFDWEKKDQWRRLQLTHQQEEEQRTINIREEKKADICKSNLSSSPSHCWELASSAHLCSLIIFTTRPKPAYMAGKA